MVIAKLVGKIWATRKYESLNGMKLMLVEIVSGTDAGKQLVAVDTIGAGEGDLVLVTQGSSARKVFTNNQEDNLPVDAVISGIIDEDCKW